MGRWRGAKHQHEKSRVKERVVFEQKARRWQADDEGRAPSCRLEEASRRDSWSPKDGPTQWQQKHECERGMRTATEKVPDRTQMQLLCLMPQLTNKFYQLLAWLKAISCQYRKKCHIVFQCSPEKVCLVFVVLDPPKSIACFLFGSLIVGDAIIWKKRRKNKLNYNFFPIVLA